MKLLKDKIDEVMGKVAATDFVADDSFLTKILDVMPIDKIYLLDEAIQENFKAADWSIVLQTKDWEDSQKLYVELIGEINANLLVGEFNNGYVRAISFVNKYSLGEDIKTSQQLLRAYLFRYLRRRNSKDKP